MKILESRYSEIFKSQMKSAFKKDIVNDNFHRTTDECKQKVLSGFSSESKKLII